MTLEEAQAEILRLQEENTRLTNERDALTTNNTNLTEELSKVRQLNQTYFNKLSAQYSEQAGEKDEEAPTCEDFAKTLNI